jgi:type II secretory pathway component PulC
MGRPLRLLNLTLGLVAVLIAAALAKTWVSPTVGPIPASPVSKPSQETAALAFAPTTRPPLSHFDVLLEKNPFKQPPPPPAPRVGLPKPAPPSPPLPALIGTILVDDKRQAILSEKGKADIYSVNQEAAGGVITEISEERIIFKRGEESVKIFLKGAIETVPSSGGQAVTPPPPVLPLPTAPPGVVSVPDAAKIGARDQSEREKQGRIIEEDRERRRQEIEMQREQRRLLRQQPKNQ